MGLFARVQRHDDQHCRWTADLVRGTDPELAAAAGEALQEARLLAAGPGWVRGEGEAAGADTNGDALEDGP